MRDGEGRVGLRSSECDNEAADVMVGEAVDVNDVENDPSSSSSQLPWLSGSINQWRFLLSASLSPSLTLPLLLRSETTLPCFTFVFRFFASRAVSLPSSPISYLRGSNNHPLPANRPCLAATARLWLMVGSSNDAVSHRGVMRGTSLSSRAVSKRG